MKINVMSKSESELLLLAKPTRNTAKFATTTSRLCSKNNNNNSSTSNKNTTHKRLSGPGSPIFCDDVDADDNNCGHKLIQRTSSAANTATSSFSPTSSSSHSQNTKMKRKRKIPEISWLIVAICFNCCYVIHTAVADSPSHPTNTSHTTTTLHWFSLLSDSSKSSSTSNFSNSINHKLLTSSNNNKNSPKPLFSPLTSHSTFNHILSSSANASTTDAAAATNHHHQHLRSKRATHSSPDGRHIDVDVDNDGLDPDDIHGHLQHGHHGDLVDADDLYLHNLDIGYHHDGTGLLPHELPEHDHIAHHLEMQTHEELLEDIRDDTGVNIIPDKDLPKFGEPLQNVTVPVGREAVLQCVVDNLQTYKIAWLRVDTQTILTIQNHVITKNHRMSITHAEKRAWILRIRDVKESDKGWYMCQINTDPMKSQVGYLDVVVPPDILDYPTSTDMVVREGSNVTLKCAATGSPTPTITWRREGGEPIPIPNGTEAISYNGSFLTIAKVKRLNMGAYLCIASNGIPPSVSKRVMLIIHFPPMIWIQNQLVGAAIGQNITLECQSEAFPKSINYWMKNDTIIVPGERFVPETHESGYKITMRLTINDVDAQDFGSYRCVAKNSLGDTDGAIKLYHIPQTTTVTTLAPTVSTNTVPMLVTKYHKEQRYNYQQNNNNNNNKNGNNGNNNYNHKLQRTKSKMDLPQQQQNGNSMYMGGGSSATLWNTQQQQHQHDRYVVRGEQYLGPDHPSFGNNFDRKHMQHDANSLSLENNDVYGGSSRTTTTRATPLFLALILFIVTQTALIV
ncbi:dpr-interacting protein theta isoform X2 [Musca autumnalis]|uniref:dpr-interacting protein theta isoform X2 n=1 Tax=Musca autumnalis TaxID=221902 RepID=UPI003CF1CEC5